MATFSTHLLNGNDGSHAGGVAVTLFAVNSDNTRSIVFNSKTEDGGRLVETIEASLMQADAVYELVIYTGDYWRKQLPGNSTASVSTEIVFRFEMPETNARYHVPFIFSPNQYSVWWSAPEPLN